MNTHKSSSDENRNSEGTYQSYFVFGGDTREALHSITAKLRALGRIVSDIGYVEGQDGGGGIDTLATCGEELGNIISDYAGLMGAIIENEIDPLLVERKRHELKSVICKEKASAG